MKTWKRAALAAVLLALLWGCALGEETKPWPFADIAPEDAALTVQAKGDKTTLGAGQELQLTASFAAPDKINAKKKNDRVIWKLLTKDGEEVERRLASISSTGLLKANVTIKKFVDAVVVAESAVFGTRAEYPIFLYAPVQGLRVSPEACTLYLNQPKEVRISAVTQPAGLQRALTWKIAHPEVASLTVNEDGSVTVIPLSPGTTRVSAAADSGVRASVTVTVPKMISRIRIVGNEYVRKGETLQLTAKVDGRTAEAHEVLWSVNVSEDIATINSNGVLRPGKNCPIGALVVVTCRPRSADADVYATHEVVITYPPMRLDR